MGGIAYRRRNVTGCTPSHHYGMHITTGDGVATGSDTAIDDASIIIDCASLRVACYSGTQKQAYG